METYTDLIKLKPQPQQEKVVMESGEVAKSPDSQVANWSNGEVASYTIGDFSI